MTMFKLHRCALELEGKREVIVKTTTIRVAVAAVVSLGLSPLGYAGFVQVSPPEPVPVPVLIPSLSAPVSAPAAAPMLQIEEKRFSAFSLVSVTYIGEPVADIHVLERPGQAMTVAEAIRSVVPPGWQVFLGDGLAAGRNEKEIIWSGGRTWIATLDIIGNDNDLAIEVDWSREYLYVKEKSKPLPPAAENAVPASPVEPALPVWEVRSGSNLRSTLHEWAMRAGWSFVWGLPEETDFRFGAGNSYVNEFKGAVTDLVNSLPPTVRIRVELRPDNMPPLLYVTSQREGK